MPNRTLAGFVSHVCRSPSWPARLARQLAWTLPGLVLAIVHLTGVLHATHGVPCPIIDDAFIHLQYARSFAELHPLAYHPGEGITTGNTSLLYPLLLAPLWLVGLRGMLLLWGAYAIAVLALGILLQRASALGQRLLGLPGAIVAPVAVLACPYFDFLAVGGMEVPIVAAALVMATSAAVDWATAQTRTLRQLWTLVALGVIAAMSRPEGAAGGIAVALVLWTYPLANRAGLSRLAGLLPLLAGALPALLALLGTGHVQTAGMLLKWTPADPFMTRPEKIAAVVAKAKELWESLLAGQSYLHVVVFPALTPWFRWLAPLGLLAVCVESVRRFRLRGVPVALVILGPTLAFVFGLTYAWPGNHARYLFQYISLPLICAALGPVVVVRWLTLRVRGNTAFVTVAMTVAGLAGALACFAHPTQARHEMVESSKEICAQQVAMADELRKLPPTAVVALNDAGALAYLGEHRTWDMVGLTSPDAALPYLSGAGAIFERMEALPPARRPTHLAYYPAWFAGLDIAGRLIKAIEVSGPYVGSWRKELREVDVRLYGSGALPTLTQPSGGLVDELDTADLASEASHQYVTPDRKQTTFRRYTQNAQTVADGGRVLRGEEQFAFMAHPSRDATWIIRTDAYFDAKLALTWNGEALPPLDVHKTQTWQELSVTVPARLVRAHNTVTRKLVSGADIGLFHDWLFQH